MLDVLLGWVSSPDSYFPQPCSAKKMENNEKTTIHSLPEDTYMNMGPRETSPRETGPRETGPREVIEPENGRRQNQSNNKREFSTKSANAKEFNLVEEEEYTPESGDVDASDNSVTESKSLDPLEQTVTVTESKSLDPSEQTLRDSMESESKSAAMETKEAHEFVPKVVVDLGGRDSRRTSFKTKGNRVKAVVDFGGRDSRGTSFKTKDTRVKAVADFEGRDSRRTSFKTKETSVRGGQSIAASYTTRDPSRTASVLMLGDSQDVYKNHYSPNMDLFMFNERDLTGAMFPIQEKKKEKEYSKGFASEPVREKEVEDSTSRQRESDNGWKPQPILFGGKLGVNNDDVVEQPKMMSELTKTKKAAQKKTVMNKSNLMTINEDTNPFESARDRSDHVIKELGQEKDDPLAFFDKTAFKLPTYHRIVVDNQSELSGLLNFD